MSTQEEQRVRVVEFLQGFITRTILLLLCMSTTNRAITTYFSIGVLVGYRKVRGEKTLGQTFFQCSTL